MKTKILIRQLQEADPTGEVEVCVDNCDIGYVDLMAAYWDGPLQVLVRDENKIIGAKYKRTGNKVKIHPLSISDAISNDHEIVIDYSELDEERAINTKQSHDDLREWHKQMENRLEWEHFEKWVKTQAQLWADIEGVTDVARNFFDKHISPDDPLPDGRIPMGESYVSTREMQWKEKFDVGMEDGFFKIKHR